MWVDELSTKRRERAREDNRMTLCMQYVGVRDEEKMLCRVIIKRLI